MKILASADHHFDEHGRFDECIRVHADMVALARREKVDLFLSAGDIYERQSTPKERKAVAEWLTAMAEVCPVVIAKGNHDRAFELGLLGKLKSVHPIIVVEDARVVYVVGAAIAVVAWPDRAEIVRAAGADASQADADNVAHTALRNVLLGLGQELAGHRGPRIGLGHFMVDGAVTSNGQPLLGQPIRVGLEDLALVRAHLGIMGHIHRAATYDVGGVPWAYTGGPFRNDFGQLEPKTVILAEFEGDILVRVEEIPTTATPMVHLAGNWNEEEKTLHVEWSETDVAGAECRLRYNVPGDQRSLAWSLAQDHKREILACGAVSVKVEEEVVAVKRAKAPKVSRSKTIAEKLGAHWESIGFDPGDRRGAIIAKARTIEEKAGAGVTAPTWLRLNRTRFRAMGPHRGTFELDLTQYVDEQPIIAFTGPNGNGKTFTLETAIGGACHRRMPNQGTLVTRARDRNSLLESNITAGDRTFTLRHTVDAVSGKSEALVLNEQEKPEYAGTSVKSFDAWTAKSLPDPSVLYTIQCSTQPGKRSRARFIDLDSAERISVLLKVIGVERLEVMAQLARAERDAAQVALDKAQTRLDDERDRVGDLDEFQRAYNEAKERSAGYDDQLASVREDLAKAEAELQEIAAGEALLAEKRSQRDRTISDATAAKVHWRNLEERADVIRTALEVREAVEAEALKLEALRRLLVEAEATAKRAAEIETENARTQGRRDKLELDIHAARRSAVELQRKLDNCQALLARAEEIRAAVAKRDELDATIAAHEKAVRGHEAEARQCKRDLLAVEETEGRLGHEKARLTGETKDAAEVEAAHLAISKLETGLTDATAEREKLVARIEELRAHRVTGAEGRVVQLRAGLTSIADGADDPSSIASETLLADASVVTEAARLPKLMADATSALQAAEHFERQAKAAFSAAERLASRWERVQECQARLVVVDKELTELRSKALSLDLLSGEVAGRAEDAEAKRVASQAERQRVAVRAAEAEALAVADAVAGELGPQIQEQKDRATELERELAELPPLAVVPEVERTDRLRSDVASAELAAKRLVELERQAAQLGEIEPQATKAREEVGRLSLTLLDFGDLAPVTPTLDAPGTRKRVVTWEEMAREAHAAVAVASSALDLAKSQAAKLTGICQSRDTAAADLADWERLSIDLGRGGIQSAEVDSAGPELTELCNELLHTCHGPRFTISIDTTRLSADGRKQIDECIVNVIDTREGSERDAATFSGGEKVFLGEVVENALLMLGCLRADAQNPSIVRDESGAALDPENTRAYFRMLRLVVEKTRAAHLLLVTHSPELQEMCDVRIPIGPQSANDNSAEAAE